MTSPRETPPAAGGAPSRRDQILVVAARLFARHGFHGVSIADLGAAVGVSGPALYRHFPSKEALLEEILVGISERLLAGGRARSGGEPRTALVALVAFHVDFATAEPELIVVQDRDLANLPDPARRRVRVLQRTYVEIWVDTLCRTHPGLPAETARVAAHGVFGLLNSTPYSAAAAQAEDESADGGTGVLRRMALAALGVDRDGLHGHEDAHVDDELTRLHVRSDDRRS